MNMEKSIQVVTGLVIGIFSVVILTFFTTIQEVGILIRLLVIAILVTVGIFLGYQIPNRKSFFFSIAIGLILTSVLFIAYAEWVLRLIFRDLKG